MSPSVKIGSPAEYRFVYLKVFRIPDPSSSTNPISRNTFDRSGFFVIGSNDLRFNFPDTLAMLLFTERMQSRSMISLATKLLE